MEPYQLNLAQNLMAIQCSWSDGKSVAIKKIGLHSVVIQSGQVFFCKSKNNHIVAFTAHFKIEIQSNRESILANWFYVQQFLKVDELFYFM